MIRLSRRGRGPTYEGTDWNGKSKLGPFFQLGIAIRHSGFVIDLLYRSIKNDVEGTITGEGIDLNTKTKVKTNMALSGHNNTLLRNCLPYSRAFE